MTPNGGTPSMGAAHTPTPNEPEVIADVRAAFALGRTYLYTHTGDIVCAIAELLDAYAALKAERDEWETSSTNWQADCRVAQTRLAAAERDAAYLRRAFRGAVESDKLAITYQTIGSYRAGLLKTFDALDTDAALPPTDTRQAAGGEG
jgi:hypothetical protein